MTEASLDGDSLVRLRHRLAQKAEQAGHVVRVEQVRKLGAGESGGLEAEDPLDGRALVQDGGVHRDDGDQIGRVLDERAEALLAVPDGVVGAFPLGDVARVVDDAADGRVVDHVVPGDLDRAPRPVLVAQPEFHGRVDASARDDVRHGTRGRRGVLGVDERQEVRPGEFIGIVSEHALKGRTGVERAAMGVHNRDHVGGVLHERSEALLALPEGDLGPLAVRDVSEAPDAPAHALFAEERPRISFEDTAVFELDRVEALVRTPVQFLHLRDEGRAVFELVHDEREQLGVVTRPDEFRRNAPHVAEARVEIDGVPVVVDGENSVGGGFQRSSQPLLVAAESLFGATPLVVEANAVDGGRDLSRQSFEQLRLVFGEGDRPVGGE